MCLESFYNIIKALIKPAAVIVTGGIGLELYKRYGKLSITSGKWTNNGFESNSQKWHFTFLLNLINNSITVRTFQLLKIEAIGSTTQNTIEVFNYKHNDSISLSPTSNHPEIITLYLSDKNPKSIKIYYRINPWFFQLSKKVDIKNIRLRDGESIEADYNDL